MSIDNYEAEQERRWKLGPDIVEECQAVAVMPLVDPDAWLPLFEPHDFGRANQPLLVEQYQLSQDELRNWAERAVKLRKGIAERAKEHDIALRVPSANRGDGV